MSGKKKNAVNFGAKGWGIIIYCIVVFFFYGALNNDGLNILVPSYAANISVDQGVLFTLVSWASLTGVILHIILGQIIKKLGPKRTMFIALMIGAVGFFIEAHAHSIALFVIGRALLAGSTLNAPFMCGGVLCANWFPKRKGLVMGYTTCGMNINSLASVALIAAMTGAMGGIASASIPFCIALIILAFIALFCLKDTPQEAGQYPDNVSKEVYEAEYDAKDAVTDDGGWTTGKLLRTPMVYGVAVATGLINICTGLVVSNLVSRNMELGMGQTQAIAVMSLVAAVGIFGSWFVGVLDEKFGTKKTMLGFSVWYFVANAANFAASYTAGGASLALQYLSGFMIGVSIGGSANFTTSLATSVFGRIGFDKVNSVLFPLQAAMISLNFMVSGVVRIITGNDLKFIFLCGGIISLLNVPVLLLFIKDEFKYNRDIQAERQAKLQE